MCDVGKLFSGGSLGGILGSLGGGLLDVAFPEIGIPLSLAAGAGGFGGTLLGDVASGKSLGQSIVPALETGGISGALAGVGNIAAGGDFFGAPAASLSGIFGGAAPTAADTAGAAATGAAAPLTTAGAAPATASIGTGTAVGAPAAGGGAAIGDVSTALPAATGGAGSAGANLGGSAIGSGGAALSGPAGAIGPAGPAGATSLLPTDFGGGGDFPGATFSGTGGTAGAGGAAGPYGITNPAFTDANINSAWTKAATAGDGNWFSNLFKAQPGGSFLSKGLAGEPGSIAADLTKPSTLITGGAALLPLLQGNTIPGLSDLQNQAKTLNAQGMPLAQALNTGNLPAGAQSALDSATRSAAAQVRSRYAAMGLTGSSQEADALATVDQNASAQKYAELLKTTQQGISEIGMASPILQNIMTTQLAQDQAQQQAIARLAAALAGSTGTEKTTS